MSGRDPRDPSPASAEEDAPRVLLPRRAAPEDLVRPTRAEISLESLRHNLHALQAGVGVPIWAVLKADGYGHGAKAVARTLERAGAGGVCVALLEEGIELREAGIRLPILVMSGHYSGAWGELLRHQLTPVVFRPDQLRGLAEEVRSSGARRASVHVKIDTGMARLGVQLAELEPLLECLVRSPELELGGLMTHFASAEHDAESVRAQLARFAEARERVRAHGLQPRVLHAANTAACLQYPDARFSFVRPGIGVFGLAPGVKDAPRLRPVMRLRSQIIALRQLAPGQSVGYGATWTAKRPSLIATMPLGYADGFQRALSNRADVLVRGRRAPVAGVLSMDLTGIDVTDIAGVALGDETVVLGAQKGPLGSDGHDRVGSVDVGVAQGAAVLSGELSGDGARGRGS
jgi:alanine racemase